MDAQPSLKKKILFVCIVIFLIVLFVESITRLFMLTMQDGSVVPENIGQYDPMLGWSLKPSSSGISNRTGTTIEYRINSKGLRDDETSYEKPKGVFRIVLLGDSHTFGFGVPIEKHFSTLLEGYFEDVEIINMGVSGFGVDQELLYLRSEGVKYAPDLIIAYVPHYGNHRHMHVERWGKKKPRFILRNGKLFLTNSPVKVNNIKSPVILRKMHYKMIKISKVYDMFYNRLKQILTPRLSSNRQKQLDKINLKNKGFRKHLFKLGERLIYAMHEESLNHKATFVLVTHMPELYKASLKKRLYVLNVFNALSNKKFKLPDNLKHTNECGNGVLAWEIAQFLKKNKLLPSIKMKL